MTRLLRVALSPWVAIAFGTLVLTGAVLQLALFENWLTGLVEVVVACGFYTLAGLRTVVLRIGMRLGHELGHIEGHRQAREAMYASLREAQARGMSPLEWLETELERDRGGNGDSADEAQHHC